MRLVAVTFASPGAVVIAGRLLQASGAEIFARGRRWWIVWWSSTTEAGRNILVNLTLEKSYRPVMAVLCD